MRHLLLALLLFFSSLEITAQNSTSAGKQPQGPLVLRYLALGDSYTVGTAIGKENSYASLLARHLAKADDLDSVYLNIIAQNGWTTNDLLQGIIKNKPDSSYHLVSVLIGVNNQYQKLSLVEYKQELARLFAQAVALGQNKKESIVVFSIPDWGSTPSGEDNRVNISAEIDAFNAVQIELCDSLGLKFIDITAISRKAVNEPILVATDRLHFSAEMHILWLNHVISKLDLMNFYPVRF